MVTPYSFEILPEIFNVTINGRRVWDERLQDQQVVLRTLTKRFGAQADIFHNAFAFYPGIAYFGTPLTADSTYTQLMRETWYGIKRGVEEGGGWRQVYAPFDQTDPHSKTPDNLDSFALSELDHIKVLTAEVGLFDLNRPSNGVGRECELALIAGMPAIGFSKNRVSRMDKGTPGILVLSYGAEDELRDVILEIFGRQRFETEPFYVERNHEHKVQTVIKGDSCLNCRYSKLLHPV